MEGQAATAPAGNATILTGGGAPAPAMRGVEPAAPAASVLSDGVATAERASQRPEWVPDKFWKAETGEPDYENLGRSYINLEKLVGRDKVPVPTSDDDTDGWNRWFEAAGRPAKPDDYEFKRPDSLPDGLAYDEDLEKSFRSQAHELGLNKRQTTALYERYVKTQTDRAVQGHKMRQEATAKAEGDMRREFGANYDAKIQRAKQALADHADPEYLQWLAETGAGNDPRVIRAWIKVGERMGGDTKLKGAPQHAINPVDNKRAIADFRDRYKEALWNSEHPDHKLRVGEMTALYERGAG